MNYILIKLLQNNIKKTQTKQVKYLAFVWPNVGELRQSGSKAFIKALELKLLTLKGMISDLHF